MLLNDLTSISNPGILLSIRKWTWGSPENSETRFFDRISRSVRETQNSLKKQKMRILPALALFVVFGFDITTPAQSVPFPDSFEIHGPKWVPAGANDQDPTTPNIIRQGFHGQVAAVTGIDHLYVPFPGYTGFDSYVYGYCGTTPPDQCTNITVVSLYVVADDSENAGGSCPVVPPWARVPSPYVGAPVNVTNGNMWLRQTDYALPGIGENIGIDRFYNSQIQIGGLFGLGWSTKYDEYLSIYDDHMLKFSAPDGRGVYFGRPETTGMFKSITPGYFDQVAKNTDGTYTLTFKDGRAHKFSSAGKLLTDVHGQTVEYGYDVAGNRTGVELNNVTHTGYEYDAANRLIELSDESNHHYYFDYDAANRLTSQTIPNNVVSSYTYDGMSRLTRLKHENPGKETVLFDDQHGYNSANLVSQITGLNQTRSFSYNDLDMLIGVWVAASPVESYDYDLVGNRVSSLGLSSYTHGAANRTTAAGNIGFTYNSNGSRTVQSRPLGSLGLGTPIETTTYTWDGENRLVGLHTENTGNPDQTNAAYEYDALGRRIRSTVNRAETEFTYDGQDVVKDSGFTYQNAPGIDNKLKSSDGNVYLYFLQDRLGSTVGLTDTESSLTDTNDYDSFGNATNSSFPTRYRFTGREFEGATGLQYSRARWYDPQIGRFISEDPIGFAGGDINLYGYVWNNPQTFTDPMGLDGTIAIRSAVVIGGPGIVSVFAAALPPVAAVVAVYAAYEVGVYTANHPSNPVVNGSLNPFGTPPRLIPAGPVPWTGPTIYPGPPCQQPARAIPMPFPNSVPVPFIPYMPRNRNRDDECFERCQHLLPSPIGDRGFRV